MYKPSDDFRMKTCPVCGKVFECYMKSWTYHRAPTGSSKIFLCSWKCLNEFDKIRFTQRKPRGRKRKKGESE